MNGSLNLSFLVKGRVSNMIIGMTTPVENEVEKMLRRLNENQSYIFHLTGSKFFGRDNLRSDYDFFAQDRNSVRTYLEEIGFIRRDISSLYRDSQFVCLYEFQTIDVILVKDYSIKYIAQELLKEFNLIPVNKTQRKFVWDKAYKLAHDFSSRSRIHN